MKELAQGHPAELGFEPTSVWLWRPSRVFFFFLFSLFYSIRNLFPSHIQNIKPIFTMNYASLLSFFHTKINDHFLKKTEINPEAHTLNPGTTPWLLKLLFLESWDIQHIFHNYAVAYSLQLFHVWISCLLSLIFIPCDAHSKCIINVCWMNRFYMYLAEIYTALLDSLEWHTRTRNNFS